MRVSLAATLGATLAVALVASIGTARPALPALLEPSFAAPPSPALPPAFPEPLAPLVAPVPPDAAAAHGATTRFLLNITRDQRDVYLLPFRAKPKSWLKWGPPMALAAWSAIDRDQRSSPDEVLRDEVQEDRSSGSRAVSAAFSRLGDGDVAALLWGATYLSARLAKAPHLRETTAMAGEALVGSAVLSYSLKTLSGRARPRNADAGSYLGGPDRTFQVDGGSSFPSGHAMAAVAVATVIAERNPDRKWVAPLAYTVASGVAASRVVGDHHYLSDVIVGGLAGHGLGRVIVRRHRRQAELRAGDTEPRFIITPGWSPEEDTVTVEVTLLGRAPR